MNWVIYRLKPHVKAQQVSLIRFNVKFKKRGILRRFIFVLNLGRNFHERQSIQDKQNEQPHQAYNLKDIIDFGCGIYRHKD